MRFIKLFILLVIVCFSSQNAQAQPIRFKTSSVSVTNLNERTGNWNQWSDFKEAKLVITIDGKKNLIVVNSEETQVFRILSYGETIENDESIVVPFECRDNFGSKCQILVITKKKEDNRMQFYINYEDVKFVYNIYN